MKINEKILMLRKKEGLTQEKLAEKLNISRQTVSNWESGITMPDIMEAQKLSKIFNISLDDLTDNKLEIESKDNSNNLLNNLINEECYLLINEDYDNSYMNYSTKVKVLDVNNSFIKVEYKEGKHLVNKLIDIDIITSIKVIRKEEK